MLEARNITKTAGSTKILDDVSFSVNKGEFFSILGPSGCGKTTILRILIGLLEPTSGRVFLHGRDITDYPPSERGMGIVFQDYALFENMTVLENVRYALKIKKATRSRSYDMASDILKKMNLSHHMNKRPAELSGGQRQRAAMARTLVMNPEIILFDEPMSALDMAARIRLREEILKIKAEYGTTMIYITHDQEEAFAMSDKIMVMDTARVVQTDAPEEIVRHPAGEYVRSFVIENLNAKINSLIKYVQAS